MAFTKALVSSAMVLAVLALAAADVRGLFKKSDGNYAHNEPSFNRPPQATGVHHAHDEVHLAQGSSLSSSPANSVPLSVGLGSAGLQQSGSASFGGDFRHFEHSAGSTPTFENEPNLGGSDSVFRQGLLKGQSGPLSIQDGLDQSSSSQSFGQGGPLGSSSQSGITRGTQFDQSIGGQFLGQQQAVQSFPPVFQEDVIGSSSQTTGQQQNLDFTLVSGQNGLGAQQFGQQPGLGGSPPASFVQQQDGGLMFSSGAQDTSVEETFPGTGLGPDGSITDDSFRSADGQLLSAGTGADAEFITGSQQFGSPAVVTITTEVTIDRFTTLTNLAYNSVPVTLTEFLKVTRTAPTFEAVTTPVDDLVLVSRVPVSRTDTITVTDINSGYQYATEVSTVLYTITHKHYDIRQQTITSLVVQTQLVRPRIVSTRIDTEYETQTQVQTVTHTVFLDPEVPRSGPLPVPVGLYQTPNFRRHRG